MWKSKKFDNPLLFEFHKKGGIKAYIDKDNDWNLNPKKDVLIGKQPKLRESDKQDFSKDFFYSKRKGNLSLTAAYQGAFHSNNADSYEYYLDFYKSKAAGWMPYRLVDLNNGGYRPAHLWFHNNDKFDAFGPESFH